MAAIKAALAALRSGIACGVLPLAALWLPLVFATPARAQQRADDLAAIRARLEQQEAEIRALRQQVSEQSKLMRLPVVQPVAQPVVVLDPSAPPAPAAEPTPPQQK